MLYNSQNSLHLQENRDFQLGLSQDDRQQQIFNFDESTQKPIFSHIEQNQQIFDNQNDQFQKLNQSQDSWSLFNDDTNLNNNQNFNNNFQEFENSLNFNNQCIQDQCQDSDDMDFRCQENSMIKSSENQSQEDIFNIFSQEIKNQKQQQVKLSQQQQQWSQNQEEKEPVKFQFTPLKYQQQNSQEEFQLQNKYNFSQQNEKEEINNDIEFEDFNFEIQKEVGGDSQLQYESTQTYQLQENEQQNQEFTPQKLFDIPNYKIDDNDNNNICDIDFNQQNVLGMQFEIQDINFYQKTVDDKFMKRFPEYINQQLDLYKQEYQKTLKQQQINPKLLQVAYQFTKFIIEQILMQIIYPNKYFKERQLIYKQIRNSQRENSIKMFFDITKDLNEQQLNEVISKLLQEIQGKQFIFNEKNSGQKIKKSQLKTKNKKKQLKDFGRQIAAFIALELIIGQHYHQFSHISEEYLKSFQFYKRPCDVYNNRFKKQVQQNI
ncbi:hypothetical protein PPERSA_09848 [Pseudocohnilembus persalinus]|uniref:Uncharacterized protein n=1 Tax=Pseudocohnilembus persalinus TaxID=266149 RepID=A0A0V0QTQ0_PSEPJ|nr:hypothetical protein PPERSA_09848 [Pseudocohnilembus persalinus]|eukprot:KRX05708.1 hypothetical protein PPERSA_09848 [Pseudocohnilembus persalinus]